MLNYNYLIMLFYVPVYSRNGRSVNFRRKRSKSRTAQPSKYDSKDV